MDKPKRLFPRDVRVSTRSFDRVVQKERCRHVTVVDSQKGKLIGRRDNKPSRAEAVRTAIAAVYDQVGRDTPTNVQALRERAERTAARKATQEIIETL